MLKKRLIVSLIIFFILIALLLCYFKFVSLPIIIDITKAKINSQTTAAVNYSVFTTMHENTEYSQLVQFFFDSDGKISMIQADSVAINAMARETSKMAQDNINKLGEKGLNIALGSLTGIPLLVGQGPQIHIKMTPVGSVSTTFLSEFQDGGINQTRHKLLMNVEASVNIVLPITTSNVNCNTEVLVSESIIIGNVPSTYVKLSPQDLIDLIPD